MVKKKKESIAALCSYLGISHTPGFESFICAIYCMWPKLSKGIQNIPFWASHLSCGRDTLLQLLAKFLFTMFLYGREHGRIFRSLWVVHGILIILQGVVQAYVAHCAEYWSFYLHATPDVGESLFDLQAVGGWQSHFLSSFVCTGHTWQTWAKQTTPTRPYGLKH